MKNSWTTPKIKIFPLESGKDWYVWFRFNGVVKFVKTGINKIPDYQERLESIQALAEVLAERLKKGWIPENARAIIPRDSITFIEALDFGLEKKQPSMKLSTYRAYSGTVSFFKKSAKKLKIDKLLISNCERYHIKLIMDDLSQQKGWTNKNYNKHLGYIQAIFTELVEWEHIKTNIVRDIRAKKQEKTEGYIRPTEEQKRLIFSHLKNVDYNFYIFCSVEYYLGIRPQEILNLKCEDIDLNLGFIRIKPEDSKDASYRYIPLLKPVELLLSGFDLSQKDNYLIGRPKPYGCRFFKHEYFCPNPYSIKRDTATRKWKEYIIDGLGINVKCYSLKHSGANAKLQAGMDIKTISEMFGHADEKMTEIYADYVRQIRFEKAKSIELETY
jgi:integrase